MFTFDGLLDATCVSCHKWGDGFCQSCQDRALANPITWRGWGLSCLSLGFYESEMRSLILAMKKRGQRAILKRIAPQIEFSVRTFGAEAAIPVPSSNSGWLTRGYSLPKLVAALTGLKVMDALELTDNSSQVGLGAKARRRRRAFRFKGNYGSGRIRAVLIDDVCATGATLDSAVSCCKQNGIQLVGIFTLAKTTNYAHQPQKVMTHSKI